MQNMMLKLAHRIPNVIASYLNTLYIRNTSFAILTYVTFVMDEFTGQVQDTTPWYMLFTDDIILIDKSCKQNQF